MLLDPRSLEEVPEIKNGMSFLGVVNLGYGHCCELRYQRANNMVFIEDVDGNYEPLGRFVGLVRLDEEFIIPIVSYDPDLALTLKRELREVKNAKSSQPQDHP